MLLESRISDRVVLLVDTENKGGVDKNAVGSNSHPDQILDGTMAIIQAAAERMGSALSMGGDPPPVVMEIEFGVIVDGNARVALARTPEQGHFRVKLRWDA